MDCSFWKDADPGQIVMARRSPSIVLKFVDSPSELHLDVARQRHIAEEDTAISIRKVSIDFFFISFKSIYLRSCSKNFSEPELGSNRLR